MRVCVCDENRIRGNVSARKSCGGEWGLFNDQKLGDAVPCRIVGDVVPCRIVGDVVPCRIVGDVVPCRIVGDAVPCRIVGDDVQGRIAFLLGVSWRRLA